MNPVASRATLLNIAANTVLFGLKLFAGMVSGSIALISDALNSLNDIAASIATYICVRVGSKEADEGHHFGHSRAEPIAGLIIAVLAGILGFEVIRASIERMLDGVRVEVGLFTLSVPLLTMAVKWVLGAHFRKVSRMVNSPALEATAMDSYMDVLAALAALVGIIGARMGYGFLDPVAGFVISLWIIYTGYRIGMENVGYLMGRAPEPALMEEIRRVAASVDGVEAINTVRAHYVGNFIHVEIHIEVDKEMSTMKSHAIGEEVEARVGGISTIEKPFVHIDPV